jgi:hypothetical protein
MAQRQEAVGGIWHDEGQGYWSLIGHGFMGSALAYIKLPEDHPDYNQDYDSLSPDVNGGLTYGGSGIFGWDYAHYRNRNDLVSDMACALKYFRRRATWWGRLAISLETLPSELRWQSQLWQIKMRRLIRNFRHGS